jgi:hypothetical protein
MFFPFSIQNKNKMELQLEKLLVRGHLVELEVYKSFQIQALLMVVVEDSYQ